MSAVRLLLRRGLGWGILSVPPFDGLFLEAGIGRGQGLEWGSCRSRSLGPRSLYTRSFSTIDGLWP